MLKEFKQARIMNRQLSSDHASQPCNPDMEHPQVDAGTVEAIIYLQEELAVLKEELHSRDASQLPPTENSMLLRARNEQLNHRLSYLIEENVKLSNLVSTRDAELSSLSYEWEKAIIDLTTFLIDGCRSLDDASDNIESVVESFPLKSTWISEHVERAMKVLVEKETLILDLQRGLEDAQKRGLEMKSKLTSLRGATLAITEVQQLEKDETAKEIGYLQNLLDEKSCIIQELENILKCDEDHIIEAVKVVCPATEVINKLGSMNSADSLNVGKIKHMNKGFLNKSSQAMNPQQVRNYDPENSTLRNSSLDDKIKDIHDSKIVELDFDHMMPDVPERTKYANDLLVKFEAVQESMVEAEIVLMALLKANETAKQEKEFWKQVSEGLLRDKSRLLEEVQRLEASSFSKDKHTSPQLHMNMAEISGLTSFVGESLQQVQRLTEEELNAVFSGIISLQQEMQKVIRNSKICIEDMMLEVMEKSFEVSVLYHCHTGALLDQVMHSLESFDCCRCRGESYCLLFRNEINNQNMISGDRWLVESVSEVEQVNLELNHDIQLVKVMSNEMSMCSDELLEQSTSKKEVSACLAFMSDEIVQDCKLMASDSSLSNLCEALAYDASQGDCESGISVSMSGGVLDDIKVLLSHIHYLKAQFSQLISSGSAGEVHSQLHPGNNSNDQDSNCRSIYVQNSETRKLSCLNANTRGGSQTLQASNKLTNNFHHLFTLVPPSLHNENCKRSSCALLGRSWGCLCSMEMKVNTILEKCSKYEINLVDQELRRKDELIKGLQFDLRLLQESCSKAKGMKDELEETTAERDQVKGELAIRTAQVEEILADQEVLKTELATREAELLVTRSELRQAQEAVVLLSDQYSKLKLLLEDACFSKSQAEEMLKDKTEVIEGLQSEILSFKCSSEGNITCSPEEIINELRKASKERDHLRNEVLYLRDRLEIASALADENEAIAVEARQVAEATKMHAQEKEEEVKVLERSIEELEQTINILEKKVYDMKAEVERQHSIRNGLELEIRALRQWMLTVENAAENLIAEYSNVEADKFQIPRRLDDRILELCDARRHIEDLEMEKSYTQEEINQYREHISELVLHSEAQSSLYQEKFKVLEAMVSEVTNDPENSNPACPISDKREKPTARTRGSGSPFRCISSLVQQMNLEKDQELSAARHRIDELEALAANRQKEICALTARLAATESMTHDVIRDLMGVKLDMTNYANLIDQEELLGLLHKAQQQSDETIAKEKEILNLKKSIDHLLDEKESWMEELNRRKADILASQVALEQLQQQEQWLMAQNESLKVDKANLHRRIAELDGKIRLLIRSKRITIPSQDSISGGDIEQLPINSKGKSHARTGGEDFRKRLAQSDKHLSHMRTSTNKRSTWEDFTSQTQH